MVERDGGVVPIKVSDVGLSGRGTDNLSHVPATVSPACQDQLTSRDGKFVRACTQRRQESQTES